MLDENAETSLAQEYLLNAEGALEVRTLETSPGDDGTYLYGALEGLMADVPRDRIAGAILITDGQIHDIPENTDDSVQFGPIHAMIVGGDDEVDRNIEIQQAPEGQ